jgi:hypothetical protein
MSVPIGFFLSKKITELTVQNPATNAPVGNKLLVLML